jgi:hypothetical protein
MVTLLSLAGHRLAAALRRICQMRPARRGIHHERTSLTTGEATPATPFNSHAEFNPSITESTSKP